MPNRKHWSGFTCVARKRQHQGLFARVNSLEIKSRSPTGITSALRIGVRLLYILIFCATGFSAFCGGTNQEFDFRFREGFIWVQIDVPRRSTAPLNFLLDTGAGVSALNLGTARRLGVKLGGVVSVRGVAATTTGYWPQRLTTTPAGLLPEKLLAVDLSTLSGACECPVDGLIGADFFKDRVVQIDFAAGKVRLLANGDLPRDAVSIPLKVRRGVLLAPVRVDDSNLQWVRLDTGCASALQWVSPGGATADQVNEPAVALTKLSIPLEQTVVQLGPNTFRAVPTGMHQKEIFSGESGLLGNGLISRYRSVTIDWKSRRLLLQQISGLEAVTNSPAPSNCCGAR
jgi:hypothetical protein